LQNLDLNNCFAAFFKNKQAQAEKLLHSLEKAMIQLNFRMAIFCFVGFISSPCCTIAQQSSTEAFLSDPLSSTSYMTADIIAGFRRDCSEGLPYCVFGPLSNDAAVAFSSLRRDEIVENAQSDNDFPVGGCQYLNQVPSNELFLVLMDSAYYHYYRNSYLLEAAGYPTRVWKRAVDQLFSTQVAEAVRVAKGQPVKGDIYGPPPGTARFVSEIALATFDYRRETGKLLPAPGKWPSSPRDRESSGCGGDAFTFARVKTSPTGGQVRLMTMFAFDFCSRTSGDPFKNDCGSWTYVGQRDVVDAGTYAIDVSWPNGDRACFANRSLDDDRAIDEPEGTLTYTIEFDRRASCG
jgi:hypothetical protein